MLKGKRILFFLPGLELGGAERQALFLARHLKKLGCDIRVWGNNAPGLASEMLQAMGIPWKIMPSSWPCRKQHYFRSLWRVLKTVRALRIERPDVILNYCPRPCISSGLAWRLTPVQACIWGQRDTDDLRGDLADKVAYRLSSAVVCNARHEFEYLTKTLGKTKAPVFIIHNGLELSDYNKTQKEWRKSLGIPEDATVATMVANFRYQKDHPTLLHAWNQVLSKINTQQTHLYLLLAGAHQESFQEVLQLADELELLDTVQFLCQVTDIPGLLAACDIGILTTLHEGLSNSVLEYMASGLPVVASDIPGNREALGGYFDEQLYRPGDVQELTNKISAMIHSPERRQTLGTFNQRRAKLEFSIETMCNLMTEIISNNLTGSGI
jgi:glycosyltransferase involved in cell wall biosynthesis